MNIRNLAHRKFIAFRALVNAGISGTWAISIHQDSDITKGFFFIALVLAFLNCLLTLQEQP